MPTGRPTDASAAGATPPGAAHPAGPPTGAERPLDLGRGGPIAASAAEATVGRHRGAAALFPAFDDHRPPDAAIVGDCVHCGFCLPSCPTYLLWGEEMDSPRGRIDLVKQGLGGDPLDADAIRHIDQCLGCMACVTACPSGVRYDLLIEATRAQIERRHRRPRTERAVRAAIYGLFPYPRRLRALLGPLRAYQRSGLGGLLGRSGLLARLPAPLRSMEQLAPRLGRPTALAERTAAVGTRRATVGLLTGCVQGAFFPDVNAATIRVLAAEGCDVIVPPAQPCCGALSAHGGRERQARSFAKRIIETFERAGVDTLVVNAAGCGSNLKEYGDQLSDEPGWSERAKALASKVRDVTELLSELGPVAPRHPLPITVAYQDACHLAHAQGIRSQPRAILGTIPELQVRELVEAEICCGSAGVYNLLHTGPAAELGDRKARAVLASGAEMLVTANPGCWMQIATTLEAMGQRMAVAHTVQVLDASIRGASAEKVLADGLDGPGTPMPRRAGRTGTAPGSTRGPSRATAEQ